jgi:hypothetical protein
MFAEIKDSSTFGYKKVAISEFYRVDDNRLLYGDRRYRLILANGMIKEVVLHEADWKKLEADFIRVI